MEEPEELLELSGGEDAAKRPRLSGVSAAVLALALASILALLFFFARGRPHEGDGRFVDEFNDVSDVALAQRGWSVQSIDTAYWSQRAVKPGHLALFTLSGDNWPQAGRIPAIRNLLVRRAPSKCFVADMRLSSFFPTQNWQQAGILLLEDTAFAGRSVRMSIGYNDFSGGFPQVREVIVQAITSLGKESSKPEEIVHHRLFVVDSATQALVRQNLESAALRIEVRGAHLRLLYSAGPMKNAPFKEVGVADFDFHPAHVAVFALKGYSAQSDNAPAYVDAFNVSELACTS